jgi:hypothetical protein
MPVLFKNKAYGWNVCRWLENVLCSSSCSLLLYIFGSLLLPALVAGLWWIRAGGCITFFLVLFSTTEMTMLCAGCKLRPASLPVRPFQPCKPLDQLCAILLRLQPPA